MRPPAVIGSCVEAGYTTCCSSVLLTQFCVGSAPFNCFCDLECAQRDDCCPDIADACPSEFERVEIVDARPIEFECVERLQYVFCVTSSAFIILQWAVLAEMLATRHAATLLTRETFAVAMITSACVTTPAVSSVTAALTTALSARAFLAHVWLPVTPRVVQAATVLVRRRHASVTQHAGLVEIAVTTSRPPAVSSGYIFPILCINILI